MAVGEYLAIDIAQRTDAERRARLSSCDVLFGLCKALRDQVEACQKETAEEAGALYTWISDPATRVGLFDEREYLLGEVALIAAKSTRLLGKFHDAERWLDRSEANFRHTINATGPLAGVAFERMAIRYTVGRFEDVLELIPSVTLSFKRLGMQLDEAKARFLEAITRKSLDDAEGSFALLTELESSAVVRGECSLYGQVLIQIGQHFSVLGRHDLAAETYEAALPAIVQGRRPIALAELKWAIGEAYRSQGALRKALTSYRSARDGYIELAAMGFACQVTLAIADLLLSLDHPREAEWEILQALPTIEEQKMVPEGFAAVALLRESVKRKKADPNALRELREHLQKQN